MKTRIIHTEVWADGFFSDLNPDEKLLWLYLLTNETVNIIHLYRCPTHRISADTGLSVEKIKGIKSKFEKLGKAYFFEEFVFLKNAHKYESYTGDRNEIAKEKIFSKLSASVLAWYKAILDTPMHTPIDGVYIPSINKKEEIINNKEGGMGGENLTIVKGQKELRRPDKLTDHTVSHYVIELFRDINPDVARLHKLKTEADASLTLYGNAVKGNLDQLERAIQAIPDIAADPYCPKEIKSISKPSQLLTHWALYCAQARGKRDAITNSGPLIL